MSAPIVPSAKTRPRCARCRLALTYHLPTKRSRDLCIQTPAAQRERNKVAIRCGFCWRVYCGKHADKHFGACRDDKLARRVAAIVIRALAAKGGPSRSK